MYHLCVKNIGKQHFARSAIGAAAYRSGSRLVDEETGKVFDYRKKEVYRSEILCANPEAFWAKERQSLWSAVHHENTRKNALYAKEIELALPNKLSHETKIELTKQFVWEEIVSKYGVVADIGWHNFDGVGSTNPHAHIMLTVRSVENEGFGKRVSALAQRNFVFNIRKAWADHANQHLSAAGLPLIDERSCLRQGRERRSVPMGYEAWALEKKGERTRPGKEHRLFWEKGKRERPQPARDRAR